MLKPPLPNAQLGSKAGLARLGGAASKGSKPIQGDKGSRFAAMENALLKAGGKSPKKLHNAPKPGRHFFTQASGGDQRLGTRGSTPKADPSDILLRQRRLAGDNPNLGKEFGF
jgi:hypothetical protein